MTAEEKNIKYIVSGKFATVTSASIQRNVNGGIVGGVIGIAYAWHTKSSIWTHGLFGFMIGAFVTGVFFPAQKRVVKKEEKTNDE